MVKMEDLLNFAKKEHERQVNHHNVKGDPKVKYLMLAKLMEELGELSDAILKSDSLQRTDKLENVSNLEGELADVVLVTLNLAQELGIDMKKALTEKMAKITQRKY